jgi:hypothetical protein
MRIALPTHTAGPAMLLKFLFCATLFEDGNLDQDGASSYHVIVDPKRVTELATQRKRNPNEE